MRKLYQENEWVLYQGKRYQVEMDYEDWIYLKGVTEPIFHTEIKKA